MNKSLKFIFLLSIITFNFQLSTFNCFSAVSETTSYVTITTASTPADGSSPATVIVTVQDSYGTPLSGKTVNVNTQRGGLDTINYPSGQTTDANGVCTASIVSSTAGADTVWAVVDGSTITQNLIPNPSFELGAYSYGGSPDNWTKVTVSGSPLFSWQKVFYSGDKSVAICTPQGTDNGYWKSASIQVTQNVNYRLSLYYKCFNGGIGSADITLDNYGWSWSLSSPTSWTKWSDIFLAESSQIDIRLSLNGRIGQTVWFDDLRLERIPNFSFGATRIKFISSPQTVKVNAPSDTITVAARDNSGNTDTFFNEIVDLISSSGTGKFSLTNTPWSDITQISLNSGVGTFYYKNTTDGAFTITASRTGLISDSQPISVIFGAIKLKFTTTPGAGTAGTAIGLIQLKAWNAKDQTDGTYQGYATLSSSSSNGYFSLTDDPWTNTNVFTITNGISPFFYYKDYRAGTHTITASSGSLADTSYNQVVNAASPSDTASYFRVSPTYVYANGTSGCSISIYLKDNYGNPVSGKAMDISATFGTIIPPSTLTNSNGQCTGGITSLDSGNVDTVTATVQVTLEVVSQNLVNNPSLEEGVYASDSSPANWTKLNEGGTPSFSWQRTAYSGDKSISIFTPDVSSKGAWIPDAIAVEAGKSYSVNLYYKTYTTGSPKFTIDNQSWLLPTSGTWVSWGRTITTQTTTTSLNIKLLLEGKTGQTVWFDCISLQRVPCFVFTASKLKITSPERTVRAGLVSDSVTIEARDGNNNRDWTFNETVILSTSSGLGNFSLSNTTWANTTILILSSGYAVFYYKDGTPDSPVITVSRAGLFSDTQTVNVLYGAIKLKFTSSPRSPRSGSASDTIIIEAWTDTNSADVNFNNTVTLSTSGNSGQFSIDKVNWSSYGSDTYIYLTSGVGKFYYRDFNMGTPVITASRWDLTTDTQVETILVSRLKIITSPRITRAGISSDSIVVEARDENGTRDSNFSNTVTLATSSSTGTFSTDNINWTPTTIITLAGGQGYFYYKDNATGNPVMTVSRAELYSDTQIETVIYGAIKLKIITPARITRAGIPSDSIAIEARTNTDDLDVGYNGVVALATYSNSGVFSINNAPWVDTGSINLVGGQATFYYKDHLTGASVITVSRTGLFSDTQVESTIYGAIKLKITTPQRQERANWPTNYITVQAWTDTDNLDVGYSGSISLTTSSNSGVFSVSSANWVDTTSVNLVGGQANFYYKDRKTGSPTITVSRTGLYSDSQTENIIYGAIKLKITTPQRQERANWSTDFITVQAWTDTDDLDVGFSNTVTLTSSSGQGKFSTSSTQWSDITYVTLSSGQANFYYKDRNTGLPTITVSRASFNSDAQSETIIYGAIKLKITTPQRQERANWSTDYITVQAWTDTDDLDVSVGGTVTLTSSSGQGKFSVSSTTWVDTDVITLSGGQANFYYKDRNTGFPTITVSRANFNSDAQSETIIYGAIKLKITTPQRTERVNWPTDYITVQAWTDTDDLDVGYSGVVALATSSNSGVFSVNNTPWVDTTSVNLVGGQANFYYKDRKTGSPTITVSRSGLYSDSQTENIIYGAIKLKITTPQRQERANWPTDYVTVQAWTDTGDLDVSVSGTVTLTRSSGQGKFSVSSTTWVDTDVITLSGGQANFYYKDRNTGFPIITVSRANFNSDAQSETIIYGAIKLKITTSQRTARVGVSSDSIVVEAWTDTDVLDSSVGGTIALVSSSNSGVFSVDKDIWVNTTTIYLSGGKATFYYKDKITGNPVITLTKTNFLPDTQVESIIYGAIKLKITTPQRQERANWPTNYITVQAQTDTGDLDLSFGGDVILSTTSGQGKFSTTSSPWSDITSVTLSGGQTNFYYKDRTTGSPVITVSRALADLFSDTQIESIIYGAIKLKIVTPSRTVRAGSASESIAVQTLTDTDARDLTYNGTVTYISSTSTGKFSADGVFWSAGNSFTAKVSSGETYVYYKDTSMGTPNIMVSRYNADMIDTSQAQVIIVSRLKFTTSSHTFKAGLISGVMTVQAQDEDGNKDTSFNNTVTLATSSNSGSFSVAQDPWIPITVVTFVNGDTSFYYRDYITGSPVITVSRTGLISDTQVENVTYGAIKLKIVTPARTVKAGSTSESIAVQAYTDTNARDLGYSGLVNYTASSATGKFSIDGISWTDWQINVNIAGGETFVYYKDTDLGTPTITVADISGNNLTGDAQGETIVVSRLRITTSPQTTRAGWPTGNITVEAQDENNHRDYSYSGTITLSTSSNTGFFSLNSTNWKDTTVLTLSSGSVTFYYKDGATGYPVITVSRLGLTSETQVEEIIYGAVKIKIITPARSFRAGWISDSIAIQAQTNTGALDPISGVVALATSSNSYSFSLSNTTWQSVGSVNLVNGEAIFYYSDHITGSPRISVSRTDYYSDTQTENITYGAIKLKIVTSVRTVRAGATSDSIVVQAQTDTGAKDTSWTGTITLYTSGESGQFYTAFSPPWYASGCTTTLISGQGYFYYRDFNMGNPTITVTRDAGDLISDVQSETILVSRLKITTPARTVKAGLPTDSITIEAQDENGKLDSNFSGTITLSTDSSTGSFSVATGDWKDTTIINISNGQAYFYYKDNATGFPRVTVSSAVLTSDSQVHTIVFGAIKLKIITPPRTVRAGLVADSIVVQAQTNTGALDTSINSEVYLATTSSTGSFSVASGDWIETTTITLAGGQAQFYYKDNATGSPKITVSHTELFADSQVQSITYGAIRLKIVTDQRWLTQYTGSESICVHAQTNTGTPDVTYSGTVTLVTSSGCNTAGFNTQTNNVGAPGWVYTTITVKMTQGQAYVYYRDAELGTKTITISRYNGDLPGDTQQILVRKGFPWFSDTSAIPYWISPNMDGSKDTVTISYYLGDEDDVEDTVILYVYDDSVLVYTLVDTKTRSSNAAHSEVWDGQFIGTHEGNYHFYINAFDKEGNYASFWNKDVWGHFAMDLTMPNTGSVLINNNFPYADTVAVVLTLYSSDTLSGVSRMLVSNYPDFSIGSLYSYGTSLNWNLAGGDTQVVYVQFIDTAGNYSITYSDAIFVNTGPPRIAWTSPVAGETNVIPTVTVIAQFDKRMNPASFSYPSSVDLRLFKDNSTVSGAVTYDSSTWRMNFKPGSPLTYLETYVMYVKGGAGKVSDKDGTPMASTVTWQFTISDTGDITRPFGWVVINESATYVNTTVVVLNIFANDTQSNIKYIYISSNPPIPENTIICDSKPYSGTTTWIIQGLTQADMSAEGNSQASRVVSVWFEDTPGNVSIIYSDSIILDTQPPGMYQFEPGGSYPNRLTDVILTFNDLMNTSSFIYDYTVSGGTFQLEEAAPQLLIPAGISFSEIYIPNHSCPVTVVKIDPNDPLNTSTLFRVTITTGIKDKVGNNLTANRVYFFTTSVFSDTTIPKAIEQLRLIPITSTRVQLNWNPVTKNTDGTDYTDTESYIILRSESQGTNHTAIDEITANTTTFTDTTLIAGKTYYYIVVAKDTSKNSGPYLTEVTSKGGLIFRMSSDGAEMDTYTNISLTKEAVSILDASDSKGILITKDSSKEGEKAGNLGTIVAAFDFTPYLINSGAAPGELSFAPYNVTLTLHYKAESGLIKGTNISSAEAIKYLSVVYWNGIQWVRMGGAVDLSKQTISTTIDHLSKFAIAVADVTAFKVFSAEPNPFTPYRQPYDKVVFSFSNPDNAEVILRIFDLTGALVYNKEYTAGTASAEWNGKEDRTGNIAEDGVYVYQVQAGSKFYTGTIILAK